MAIDMNTTIRSIALGAGIALVILVGVFSYQYIFISSNTSTLPELVSGAAEAGEEYINEQYGFSFILPKGFSVRELPGVVVVENNDADGVQIVITALEEDIYNLTLERIQADLPGITIEEPEELELEGGRTGLAFKSDNEAFDGASREVWFVFDSRLYQISTYERLGPLLGELGSTWTFLKP